MTKYKLVVNSDDFLDNYLLPRTVLGNSSSKAFNAQGDVSEPYKDGTSNSYSSVKEK